MLKKSFKMGFTLAEILVTIGIIGVVAAVSMPSLIANVQKNTYVTQFHKAYSDISNVMVKYMSDEKVESLKEAGLSNNSFSTFFNNYFNVVKKCDNFTDCFSDSYTYLDGAQLSLSGTGYYSVLLESGAAIGLKSTSTPSLPYVLIIDVNGQKAPNRVARDLFAIYLTPDGKFYKNSAAHECGASFDKCRGGTGNYITCSRNCFAKIIKDNWEMNY